MQKRRPGSSSAAGLAALRDQLLRTALALAATFCTCRVRSAARPGLSIWDAWVFPPNAFHSSPSADQVDSFFLVDSKQVGADDGQVLLSVGVMRSSGA